MPDEPLLSDEILRAVAQGPVLASQLGVALARACPNGLADARSRFGRKFRDIVSGVTNGAVEERNPGAESYFVRADAPPEVRPQSPSGLVPARLARILLSPSSFERLYVRRSNGEFIVRPAAEPEPGDGWTQLPPIPAEELNAAAAAVVAGVPDSVARQRLEVLARGRQWDEFWRTLWAASAEAGERLQAARFGLLDAHLRKHIGDGLLAAELTPLLERMRHIVVRGRPSSYAGRREAADRPVAGGAASAPRTDDALQAIDTIVARAGRSMCERDLREHFVPLLGAVLRVLAGSK